MVTYDHVYSHQDDPAKLMKIDPLLTFVEAIRKAKNPSVQALVNIACDKEATRGQEILEVGREKMEYCQRKWEQS